MAKLQDFLGKKIDLADKELKKELFEAVGEVVSDLPGEKRLDFLLDSLNNPLNKDLQIKNLGDYMDDERLGDLFNLTDPSMSNLNNRIKPCFSYGTYKEALIVASCLVENHLELIAASHILYKYYFDPKAIVKALEMMGAEVEAQKN